MVRFVDIEEQVKSYNPAANLDLIRSAYVYSAQVHVGQKRKSGEPYLVHPLAVARILADMKLDEAAIATGLLHDTVEDTLATSEELQDMFGQEIATLVDGVTKLSKVEFQSKEERDAENFRKILLAMTADIRVLLVKLADRLHNMRTLGYMSADSQKRTAQETLDIYAPLAGRMGIYWLKTELEGISFRYIEPETYRVIEEWLKESIERNQEYINSVLATIRERLHLYKIKGITRGRNKEVYSIHRKMQAQNLELDQIHDFVAFRIIVDSVSDCYAVLGFMHSLWRPVPGRFKDYIAVPKGNNYRSLHTTVVGPQGNRIEIQIRTHDMDLVAEQGIAAHWSYKECKPVDPQDIEVIGWLRQMMDSQKELEDPREFLESVRMDLFPEEVMVFTPKGDVRRFPKGSTPLDFAYAIHTEVGHRCVGARVNGKMVPLRYQLKTGDSVEVITSAHQKPSKDWLKFVKTGRARTKIRHFVLQEERDRAVQIGKENTERELKRFRIDLSKAEKDGEILRIAREYSFRTEQDLYAAVGYGRMSAKAVITKLVPMSEREKPKLEGAEERAAAAARQWSSSRSGVRVQGLADLMVKFGKCCSPLPGDRIKGFITIGRGVTIHKADCLNVQAADSLRVVDATWDDQLSLDHVVHLEVHADDKVGLLAVISGVFASNNSNIVRADMRSTDENGARGTFTVSVKNLEHLNRIITGLKNIKGVHKVDRLGSLQSLTSEGRGGVSPPIPVKPRK
jgi:GTP diphosphokinase / guanosine-3',5'-bis(diphosphate) 3'-diphosphatase